MARKKNHSLPFIVLAIVMATLAYEAYTNTEINLEDYKEILIAIGMGGAAKSIFNKAIAARKIVPDSVKEEVRKAIAELKSNTKPA